MLLRLGDFTIKLYFPPPITVYSSTADDTLNQPFVLMGLSLLNSREVLSMEPVLVIILSSALLVFREGQCTTSTCYSKFCLFPGYL